MTRVAPSLADAAGYYSPELWRQIGLLFLLLAVLVLENASAAEPAAKKGTPVEHVTAGPRRNGGQGLGTIAYKPSEQEQPFFAKLAEKEKTTGGLTGDYDIAKKEGVSVGWFGIVREITEDAAGDKTTLLVEHKYFDGLTDAHIQALSFNGSGDFRAVLRGTGHSIELLSLVKVYGTVAKGMAGSPPQVDAVFVRDWHWGTFTFLAAHGKQRGSEQWRRLNEVELESIYDPYPGEDYYRTRLGKRPGTSARVTAFYKLALEAAKAEGLPAGAVPPPRDDAQPPKSPARIDVATFRTRALKAAVAARPGSEKVIQPLIEALAKEESPGEAAEAAVKAEMEAAAAAVLAEALQMKQEDVRISAAETLGELGFASRTVLASLVAALRDENEYVPNHAAEALGNIGPEAHAAVPALLMALGEPNEHLRSRVVEALGKIHSQPKYVVPALIAALQDDDSHVRFMTPDALREFGPEAAAAAEPLREALLRDVDGDVRWISAGALAAVDSSGKIAIPALLEALRARDPNLRRFAASAVGRFGPQAKEAAPLLLAGLQDKNAGARIEAAGALWKVNGNAKAVVPVLVKVLEEDPTIAHTWACTEIENIGPEAKEAVPALRKLLAKSPWPGFAIQALRSIGEGAAAAVPDLVEQLESKDGEVRALSASALWKINRHPRAIPVILEELKHPVDGDSFYAIIAAGQIGPPAKAGVPELLKALSHRTLYVRQGAAEALAKVDPSATPRK